MIIFIRNVGVDIIVAYMSTLIGAMIYFTFAKTPPDEPVFLQFLITLLALRFYRIGSFIKRHGQSEQV